MFTKIRMKEEKGFTLIELLIVVAIIGILAAIAIPQFSAYRIRGYNSAAHSDLKNILTSEEAYFVDKQKYYSKALTTGAGTFSGAAKLSSNVVAGTSATSDSTGTCYNALSAHTQGDRLFTMESEEGAFAWTSKVAGSEYTTAVTAAVCNASEYSGTAL